LDKLTIALGDRSYDICIGDGLLRRAAELIIPVLGQRRAAILSDETVWSLWGDTLSASLHAGGVNFFPIIVPPGEGTKSMPRLAQVLEDMADGRLTRSDYLIAFGGGVVGDLGGFAASIYMRGISYVQIPTTILAQVDSSVGGKTAVSLEHGKNLVGAFWQPRLVISDTGTLQTLPTREIAGGMAEVIKYGLIRSRPLYNRIAALSPDTLSAALPQLIGACCDIKRTVVERDERDTGERMILNLGHTFGHAIETMGAFTRYIHGEAVAIGMVLAARYGEQLGITPKGLWREVGDLCVRFGLPAYEQVDLERVAKLAALDKKAEGDRLTLILLRDIGEAVLYPTTAADFRQTLMSLPEVVPS